MEMNTCIQVEHPVTEEVVDYDLIKEQIKLAAGRTDQWEELLSHIACHGMPHQRRRPVTGIQTQSGKIVNFHSPKVMVFVDTAVYAGYVIPHIMTL